MKAITNAKIYTVTGETYEKGTVLFENGKIVAVGADVQVPEGAEVYDATGMIVTPGLIDAHTHLMLMHGREAMPGQQDYNEMSEPVTPAVRALDALNPFDTAIGDVRGAGFTTCYTGPGSANVIGGMGCSFKLRGKTADEMMIPGSEMMKMALGENPKRVFGNNGKSPMTRMGSAQIAREWFNKALEYAKKKEAGKDVNYDAKLEALVPVVKGEMRVRIHCHEADDITTAIRLGKEFGLDYSVEHGTEGQKIADYIAAQNIFVVNGPILMGHMKEEIWESTPNNPGVLDNAGVKVCLTADNGWATQWLPAEVGIVIRRGMKWEHALEALTIRPAQLLKLEDKVGSIEVGKDADFAVFNGDPFCNYTECLMTFIDGELLSDKR